MDTKERLIRKFRSMEEELKFLRYFFDAASDAMGPADGDIYTGIAEDFVRGGGTLPENYKYLVGDDEEE